MDHQHFRETLFEAVRSGDTCDVMGTCDRNSVLGNEFHHILQPYRSSDFWKLARSSMMQSSLPNDFL